MDIKSRIICPVLLIGFLFVASGTWASNVMYEVTITNLTRGSSFTPVLVASHRRGVQLFELGSPVSDELAALAEGGDTAPLNAVLAAHPRVVDTASSVGLLGPGETTTVMVRTRYGANRISLASMLLPTNDAFFALNSARAPRGAYPLTHLALAYDAGSEPNDELCANIPGPTCGGEGGSPAVGAEDYVHVHSGIHGVGDLSAAANDWRNPVAKITIRKIRLED